METELNKGHGKKENQKLKPLLLYFYLMKYSDEEHTVSASELVEYFKEQGIYAERRSIYRDIEAMNLALWMVYNEADSIEEAEEALEDEEERVIVYDKHSKGFFVHQRRYEVEDVQLIAECVYAAKFVEAKRSKQLLDVVLDLISENQAEGIRHSAFLTERAKTTDTETFWNVIRINDAMKHSKTHEPEKIKFKYQKRSINNIKEKVDRRGGKEYIVSPYELLINDGNYYLLAYSDIEKAMRTYRVDRMKSVKPTGIEREGKEEFQKIDMTTYTRRVFSMYGGRKSIVSLQCKNGLIDTVFDRFGSEDVTYSVVDKGHFRVSTIIEVSDQFFGWVLGLGDSIKIVHPPELIEEFTNYLDKIRKQY